MREVDLAPFADQYHFELCDDLHRMDADDGLPDCPGVYILGETARSANSPPNSSSVSGFRYPFDEYSPIFFIGCSWIRCNGRIWQLTLREHWTLNKEFMVTLGADNHQYTYPDEIMYAAGITHLSCAWHIPNLGTRTPFDYQASLLDIFRDKFGAKPVANNWPDGRRIDWDTWVRDKMRGAYPP